MRDGELYVQPHHIAFLRDNSTKRKDDFKFSHLSVLIFFIDSINPDIDKFG